MKPLGEAASELPWLAPAAGSLAALARLQLTCIDAECPRTHLAPRDEDLTRSVRSTLPGSEVALCVDPVWNALRCDPGAVLLLLRTASQVRGDTPISDLCYQPKVLETALEFLAGGRPRFIAWNKPGPDKIYRQCLKHAGLAEAIARKVGRCDAQHAWIGGLLAGLGWLALCALDRDRTVAHVSGSGAGWQHEKWGLDHAAVVRRLSRAWRLPVWLAATVSHLGLPVEIAYRLGAEPVLFQVVQLAVAWSQKSDPGLALSVGASFAELLRSLDLSPRDFQSPSASEGGPQNLASARALMAATPRKSLLLNELVEVALAAGRQRQHVLAEATRRRIDLLHKFLAEQRANEHLEVHSQKMLAMAELAAGAGHEINNPLAVISGQAQYIARQLDQAASLIPEEPALAEYLETVQAGIGRSLKTIVGQSQRIHHILVDLMQFARPSPPRPQIVGIRELLRDLAQAMQDLAHVKKVRLAVQDVPDAWRIRVDANQLSASLHCLLQNAIEAAGPEGWAGLRAESSGVDTLKLLVEDSGPGPTPEIQEHMFDPFYSGRSAGRGKGLGLPIAWRLAQQQGGAVCFDGHVQGITRFVLSLPGLQTGYDIPQMSGEDSTANRLQEPELSDCVA